MTDLITMLRRLVALGCIQGYQLFDQHVELVIGEQRRKADLSLRAVAYALLDAGWQADRSPAERNHQTLHADALRSAGHCAG